MSPTMTRRRLLAGAVGAAGATALAACGETQIVERVVTKEVIKEVPVEKIVMQTQIKEVPVDRVVTQIVEKVVEASAQARPVTFDFNSDHVSGPRGKSLQWAIGAYAQLRPMTRIRFRPQADWREKVNIQAVAGTLAEINLLSDRTFQQWVESGAWLQINDLLAKHPDFTPDEYHFSGDVYTDNKELPGPLPYDDTMRGPQYGMPYQGAGIAGLMYNVDLLEGAGVPEPQDGWDFDDLLEGGRDYVEQTGRRVTFAYALIEGINDEPEQARRLAAPAGKLGGGGLGRAGGGAGHGGAHDDMARSFAPHRGRSRRIERPRRNELRPV